jgi:hypothetical protein
MKNYTKELAAIAVLSLFAYSANAATLVGDPLDPDVLINGELVVQPALVTVVDPVATTPGAGEQTELGGVVAGTGGDVKIIQTLIDSNDASQTGTTGGGFSADTDGNATLSAATSETTSVSYGRAVTQEVAQPGNTNPVGLGIAGTEQYYVVNLDTDAQISGPYATEADLDAFLATQTPASLLALDPSIGAAVDNPATGGNLQVGGNANVDGTLTVNGVDVGQSLTDIRGEFAAADTAIRGEFAAADTAIRGEFAAADTAIRGEFAAADDVVRGEFAAADDVVRGEFAAADDVVRGEFAAADDVVRGEFAADE